MRNDMQQKLEQRSRSIFVSAIVAGVLGTAAFNVVMYIDILLPQESRLT
jgi:hypothetical protein